MSICVAFLENMNFTEQKSNVYLPFFFHSTFFYSTEIRILKIMMPLKVWYFVFVIGVTLSSEETDKDPKDRHEKSKLHN